MKKISIYKHFNEVVEEIDIMDVLKRIESPAVPHFFTSLRELYKEAKDEEYTKTKKSMTAFTVTGTFNGGRKPELMTSYSGLIILDFDKLGDILPDVKKAIVENKHTFACFLSPSGDGLKVIVQVDTKQEEHSDVFNAVAEYYAAFTGVNVDVSGKDITRLCFLSCDPEIYINDKSEHFAMPAKVINQEWLDVFNKCVELAINKHQFVDGQRNVFVFLLANNCKRLGLPEDIANSLILADYNYDEKEVRASVKSAYQNSPEEYAKFASLTNLSNDELAALLQFSNEEIENTSLIPDEIFTALPALLKEGADVFDDKRQRDVFLTGALSVIGGSLDKVSGVYHQHVLSPNLYVFVVANAASGKGALKYSKMLGQNLHADYIKQGHVPPRLLYIPANSSASAVIKHLTESGGKGIIIESEADTLNNSLKQEWGNFSDMLRKAFHHEAISMSRTGNDQFIEVDEPRLSIALSGTPNQILGLIPSAEDGLFSRFGFYVFQGDTEWKDARPNEKVNFDNHFKTLSSTFVKAYQFLLKHPTNFNFTDAQWDEHTNVFNEKLNELTQFVSPDLDSSVKRMGLIMFRISMILTALRKAESESTTADMICSDGDFKAAMELAMIYLEHVVIIFKKMPKTIKSDPSKQKFFEALPRGVFARAKAVEIGKAVGIADRTVDKYLKELTKGKLLANDLYGKYKKP